MNWAYLIEMTEWSLMFEKMATGGEGNGTGGAPMRALHVVNVDMQAQLTLLRKLLVANVAPTLLSQRPCPAVCRKCLHPDWSWTIQKDCNSWMCHFDWLLIVTSYSKNYWVNWINYSPFSTKQFNLESCNTGKNWRKIFNFLATGSATFHSHLQCGTTLPNSEFNQILPNSEFNELMNRNALN